MGTPPFTPHCSHISYHIFQMAPGSTKSRRSARKYALREDDPEAQYEVSHRKETRTTQSGRKKTVIIEESLRGDAPPPPKHKKRKTSPAPAADDNESRPDENFTQPDMDVITGHNRPCKVCILNSQCGPKPASSQRQPDPKGLHYTICAPGTPFA